MTTWPQPESLSERCTPERPGGRRARFRACSRNPFLRLLPLPSFRDASSGAAANNRFASANPIVPKKIWSIFGLDIGSEVACAHLSAGFRNGPDQSLPEKPRRGFLLGPTWPLRHNGAG